jgi:chemotaxis-related protein WspD
MNGSRAETCWQRIGIGGDRSCPELKAHVHCRNCPSYAAGAARLLEVELTPEQLAEQTARYAQPKALARPGARSVVIFRLGAEWLALPTAAFRSIAPPRRVHSLPHRRDGVVLGVANLRGELIVCVSLAAVLGLAAGPDVAAAPRLAVIAREGDRFVFPADEIAGLQRFDDAELLPVPATLAHAQATYTRGILPWQGRAVGVLDEPLLFHTLNHRLA